MYENDIFAVSSKEWFNTCHLNSIQRYTYNAHLTCNIMKELSLQVMSYLSVVYPDQKNLAFFKKMP